MDQEVRGHHFDEKKIRIVWSRRPYLRRFGGSFTVPELQSLPIHHRPRDFLKGTFGTGKKEAFPNKIPTQLQHFSSFFHFQLPCSFREGLQLDCHAGHFMNSTLWTLRPPEWEGDRLSPFPSWLSYIPHQEGGRGAAVTESLASTAGDFWLLMIAEWYNLYNTGQ